MTNMIIFVTNIITFSRNVKDKSCDWRCRRIANQEDPSARFGDDYPSPFSPPSNTGMLIQEK